MTYQLETAQTAKFPAPYTFVNYPEQAAPIYPGDEQAEVILAASRIRSPLEIARAISLPSFYPEALVNLIPKRPEPVTAERIPRFSVAPIHGPGPFYETIIETAADSSVTEPRANTFGSVVSSIQDSTSAGSLALIIAARAADISATKAATEWLSKARAAALAGNLRLAYHAVYRGLDELFRRAKWTEVSTELEAICSDQYPASFGIGAMRFASNAANRIPKWDAILEQLIRTARQQEIDVRKAMRGLVKTNGAP